MVRQDVTLRLGLDTFCDDSQAQGIAERDDCLCNGGIVGINLTDPVQNFDQF